MTHRRTKIVATYSNTTVSQILRKKIRGLPSKRDLGAALKKLAQSGVDVLRLNMSYRRTMSDDVIKRVFGWFKENQDGDARLMAVLADLQGPKLRLGDMGEEVGDTDRTPVILPNIGQYRLYYRPDRKAGVDDRTVGDDSRAVVILNSVLFSGFGSCIRQGLRALPDTPLEIGIGDGDTVLEVSDLNDVKRTYVDCRVVVGGRVKSQAGVMPRKVPVDIPAITEKDEEDLKFLMSAGAGQLSFIALSFVKSPRDVIKLKYLIEHDPDYESYLSRRFKQLRKPGDRDDRMEILRSTLAPAVIAKLETVQAVKEQTLNEIVDVADGVMVARGDLALQLDFQDVPKSQKEIIRLCRLRGKPVITATQMLHSMEKHPRPTRSEVNDVFNAVLDGTDATMLSGETSNGKFPQEAVATMASILCRAEEYMYLKRPEEILEWGEMNRALAEIISGAQERLPDVMWRLTRGTGRGGSGTPSGLRDYTHRIYDEKRDKTDRQPITDRICLSVWSMTASNELRAVVAASTSGRTGRMLARYRPQIPIFAATHDRENMKKLILSYGIRPFDVGLVVGSAELLDEMCLDTLRNQGCLEDGVASDKSREFILIVSGTPLGDPGSTNQMRLLSLAESNMRICDPPSP